jgi:hypothetical protein
MWLSKRLLEARPRPPSTRRVNPIERAEARSLQEQNGAKPSVRRGTERQENWSCNIAGELQASRKWSQHKVHYTISTRQDKNEHTSQNVTVEGRKIGVEMLHHKYSARQKRTYLTIVEEAVSSTKTSKYLASETSRESTSRHEQKGARPPLRRRQARQGKAGKMTGVAMQYSWWVGGVYRLQAEPSRCDDRIQPLENLSCVHIKLH